METKHKVHVGLQIVTSLLLLFSILISTLKVFIISLGVQVIWWAGMGHSEINGVETVYGNSVMLLSSVLALSLIWWHPK